MQRPEPRALPALVAGLAVALLLVAGAGARAMAATPGAATPGPAAGNDGDALETLEITDATFAWSINQQTQARSHNPAAINFLAAGVADPGAGGATLKAAQWRATAGAVSVQKRNAKGAWRTATWAGLGTDAAGAKIGIAGPFSGHRILLADGVGTADADADTAHLAWQGTFSVVYYSGNSVFTVTDPVLDLVGGTGTVTAALGGWATDRDDPTQWTPLPPVRVTLADLAGVDVTPGGALATPAYRGVSVTGSATQVRDGADWGSFPASMVGFLAPLGIDSFWYSTGLTSDGTKVPQPIEVGYAGAAPTATPTATTSTSPTATPTNAIKTPPTTVTATVVQTVAAAPVTVTAAPAVSTPPSATSAPQAAGGVPLAAAPVAAPVQVNAAPALASAPVPASASSAPWWIGGALLLAAALLLLLPAPRRRRDQTP